MHDETLAELLRSPLDDDPRERYERPWLLPALVGLVVGVVMGVALALATASEGEVVVRASAVTTSIVSSEVASFPSGYQPAAEHSALKAHGGFTVDGTLTAVVTSVVAAGRDPSEVPVFPGGTWSLIDVEGRTYEEAEAVTNPQAPGVTAVRFSASTVGQPRTLVVSPDTSPQVRDEELEIELPEFPFLGGNSFEIVLADNLRLRGVLLQLDGEKGLFRWSLRGADARAQVDTTVTLQETETEDAEATAFRAEHIAPPYPFQRPRSPRPAPAAGGESVLRRVGPEIVDPAGIGRALIEVSVRLYLPQEEMEIELELAPGVIGP